ncbi:F-box protein-like protein [Tanacetum coccineum]
MKELKRKRLIRTKQLEDVPELIQHIQSLLPAEDAARSCVLSKSWLRAWSTIPTLRLCRPGPLTSSIKQEERRYIRFIRRTIRRYHQDNIPIINCDLYFAIHKQKSATRVEKSIKSVASKSCLKELRLAIFGYIASFTVPDEIFSSENLNTLSIKVDFPSYMRLSFSLHISSNPLINCVNLRELELIEVHISEEAFHNLVSTCKLLEKINLNLEFTEGLKKIKVNNLHCLQQLKITTGTRYFNIEIYDVPSLRSFYYSASRFLGYVRALFKICSIRSLRELYLESVSFDDALSDMIKSEFPFLESLKLRIMICEVEIMDIRCATLQRLEIESWVSMPIKVQANAPKLLKLLFYLYESVSMPSLLFPTAVPEQIELGLVLSKPIDHLLFLKIWETLNLSSEFNIEIQTRVSAAQVQFKIDDVRTRVPFPATNVKSLFFHTFRDDDWGDNSFDAFFSICQPMYVAACYQLGLKVAKYFLKLVKKGVRKKKTVKVYWRQSTYLKRNPFTQKNGSKGKWEKLTSASVRLLEERLTVIPVSEFKLTWSSP